MAIPLPNERLVFDPGALINLLATGRAGDILRALGVTALVEERMLTSVAPLERAGLSFQGVMDEGLLAPQALDGSGLNVFVDLTSAEIPDDLDDGAAATVALALSLQANIVADDPKLRRVASSRAAPLTLFTSYGLITSSVVGAALTPAGAAAALFSALKVGRMRVTAEQAQAIAEAIGHERARDCPGVRKFLWSAG